MNQEKLIVITGFMGCGKTEIARALAHELSLPLMDLDELITTQTGRTPATLITQDGEPAFRRIETEVLANLVNSNHSAVIALGGGAWIESENRRLIREADCRSIFLDASFEICWSRIAASTEERPLGKTRAEALKRFEKRRPIYQLADIHVVVGLHDAPEDIALQISSQLTTTYSQPHGPERLSSV